MQNIYPPWVYVCSAVFWLTMMICVMAGVEVSLLLTIGLFIESCLILNQLYRNRE